MKRIIYILNSSESRYFILALNALLFLISFKQIFWEGKEAVLIQLSSIIMLPFVYALSLMIVFLIVLIYQKKNLLSRIFGILGVILIMIPQIILIEKGVFEILTLPIFLALIEIFRSSDALKKQTVMLVVTFSLLFISSAVARIVGLEKKQWIVYAVLYYFYTTYKEYRLLKN